MSKWTQFTINIDPAYTEQEREAIAEDIIDKIRSEAESGQGINKRYPGIASSREKFKGYSESYEKSLSFKIAGKKKGQEPDLTLSGDMLGALDLLDSEEGKIVIGYPEGSAEEPIAEGNIRGTYGQSRGSSSKARNFLGLTQNELSYILSKYPLEDMSARQETIDAQNLVNMATDATMPYKMDTPVLTTFHSEESDQ